MLSALRLRQAAARAIRTFHTSTMPPTTPASSALLRTGGSRTLTLSSASLHLARRPLQVRQASFVSAAARALGRMGGRVVGLGAVGAGSAAYVGSQMEGVVSLFNSAYDSAAQAFGDVTASAARGLDHFGSNASSILSSVSDSVGESISSWRDQARGFWGSFRGAGDGGEDDGGAGGPRMPNNAPFGAAAAAAAIAVDSDDEDMVSGRPPSNGASSDAAAGLMRLTRKLIEIRTLLLSVDQDESLVLPSIVVIGSQSSGKSSVLEAIVGHEFLPKGNNMVTRRPLELTLVHTPPSPSDPKPTEYAECAQFGPGRFEDFGEIQRRLTRLNLEVPDSVAVDDSPIHLQIRSPNVPDLSLVDLPGYVQISSMDQPEELREKISALCDKYIRKPNIILSVCAADVDLANSPALRASRKVDPHGYRTIGVVTKMDLVDPQVGAAILTNDKYRLALGYVGVICKAANSSGERSLLRRRATGAGEVARQEAAYFNAHADFFDRDNILFGTNTLKQRLMHVLEESMSTALHDVSNRVSLELEEAAYQFKVQYNDRPISAESYVAETMDDLKRRVADFARVLTKPRVRSLLNGELDEKVQELLAEIYWADRRTPELSAIADSKVTPSEVDPYWTQRLDAAQSRLTKSGIGRSATDAIADELRTAMGKLVSGDPLQYHHAATDRILAITDDILEDLHSRTADHVEIAVMPYRYDVEVDKRGWDTARDRASTLLSREVELCEAFLKNERTELRRNWRLREAVEYVKEADERVRKQAQKRLQAVESELDAAETEEDIRPPPVLVDRARRLRDMEFQLQTLKLRQAALKGRRCRAGPDNKSLCPEIFLNIVAERLSATATDFINIDLLSRFFSAVPNEVNSRIVKQLDGEEGAAFARQNPEIKRHLELQDRRDKLEMVMRELAALAHLQEANGTPSRNTRRRRGYFSLF